ncbi:MAG: hypothetical protein E2598_10080 [Sphingobium sp.]|nr:hypothetical protein [Sphingobium sp.]
MTRLYKKTNWLALASATLIGCYGFAAASACAQPGLAAVTQAGRGQIVVSPAPSSTSVTIYREGERGEGGFNLRWLRGYALITETRRITLPAGESTVRFEGVADGMISVSAVVTGLPGGVDEKNRDARLLSPAALLDGRLGNRVLVRRTNPATGRVSETEAIIRSGPENAVVLETPEGIEAYQCSGLPETLIYDSVPEGLSAKPTFSVNTVSPQGGEAEVTLTYLATGFDWGASYVATVAEDGKTLDLFSWLTVANGNGASYDQTQLLAIAGKPNRTSDFGSLVQGQESPVLNLSCWPMGDTTTGLTAPPPPPPPPPPPAPMAERMDMIVMASAPMARMSKAAVMAQQEDLGDLKLYRVPVRVDVVPNGQKQVALFQREAVPVTRLYSVSAQPWNEGEITLPVTNMLRLQNREKEGLGLPLPAGSVMVMQRNGQQELLLSDSSMADRAIGEKVEINAGTSDQILLIQESLPGKAKEKLLRLTLSNARPDKALVEVLIPRMDEYRLKLPAGVSEKDGNYLWAVTVPAGGRASVDLRLREQ